ncbi:MAG: hypothetical protein ABFC84_00225 [Veillonellales bacterium]
MEKYIQDDEAISDSVNLLISILVRYPEIGTIRFEPKSNLLKLTFMFAGILSAKKIAGIKQLIIDSITAYHILGKISAQKCEVKFSSYEHVTVLDFFRDVHTLSKNEIALVITLLREKCKERLVVDCNDSMLEEDLVIQEEVIESMLENMKSQREAHSLIGIREDGRVLVFNK